MSAGVSMTNFIWWSGAEAASARITSSRRRAASCLASQPPGVSAGGRWLANAAYALVVPLGAVAFLASLRLFGDQQGDVVGIAMALVGIGWMLLPPTARR